MHSAKETNDFQSRMHKLYENAVLTEQRLSSPASQVEQELLSQAAMLRQELGDIINMQHSSHSSLYESNTKNLNTFDTKQQLLSRPLSKDGSIDSALAQAMNKKLDEFQEEDEPPIIISTLPHFIPHFFRLSFADFQSLVRIFKLNVSEDALNQAFQYLNHLDVILLFFLSVLSDWFVHVRCEWVLFVLYSFQTHYKAFQESRELSLILVFIGFPLTCILWEFQTVHPWIRFIFPLLSSILVQWACIGYFRKNDPNAQAVWITFIILDALFKQWRFNPLESLLATYVTVYGLFMFFINAHALGMNERHRNEAAGFKGFTIEGQKMESWSLMALKEKLYTQMHINSYSEKKSKDPGLHYFSNHWDTKDRFELCIEHISDTVAEFSFAIPESLAASLILERTNDPSSILQSGSNITSHLPQVPPHYIQLKDVKVYINNQVWNDFKITASYPTKLIVMNLENGKSFKMRASLQGYYSCYCRFITRSSQGTYPIPFTLI